MTVAGNWPESVHAKPKPLAVTKHRSYTLRAEDSFYIHGQKNILALMTLQKAVTSLKCQLSPTPNLFCDAATEKTYHF